MSALVTDATVAHGNFATYKGSRMIINAYCNRLSAERVADGADDSEKQAAPEEELAPIEKARQANIERNEETLKALGLL